MKPRQFTRREAGIGLTEILIGLTLAVMIMAAIAQIYQASRRNYALQEGLTGLQEAARYAAQTLQADGQMAGFRGCARDIGIVTNTLADAGDFLYDFGQHVQGFEAQGVNWAPALPATVAAAGPIVGTDVLTLRTTVDTGTQLTAAMATSSADFDVAVDLTPNPVQADDIALVADCGGGAVFQVTDFNPATGRVSRDLGVGVPGNATEDLGRRFIAGAQLYTLQTVSYFVAPAAADGARRSLWRRVGDNPAEELAEGVENLQILYGVDTDGDQVPNQYRTADAVGNWGNVVSLRVALLVASPRERIGDPVDQTFTLLDQDFNPFEDGGLEPDGRLRRVLTFTVALRNRLS